MQFPQFLEYHLAHSTDDGGGDEEYLVTWLSLRQSFQTFTGDDVRCGLKHECSQKYFFSSILSHHTETIFSGNLL